MSFKDYINALCWPSQFCNYRLLVFLFFPKDHKVYIAYGAGRGLNTRFSDCGAIVK